jgi:hypothetical protein
MNFELVALDDQYTRTRLSNIFNAKEGDCWCFADDAHAPRPRTRGDLVTRLAPARRDHGMHLRLAPAPTAFCTAHSPHYILEPRLPPSDRRESPGVDAASVAAFTRQQDFVLPELV